MEHTCFGKELEHGLHIRKAEHYNYWYMEWNTEDENDPCWGSMNILHCPFCGVELSTLKSDIVVK